MKGQGKGQSFEREICKLLSRWWTNGERDDIFWRSSNSGGRAKTRSRQGKRTFGGYGDVQATDPIGQPLLDLCTIELKRGYSNSTIGDVLDAKPNAKPQQWELFVQQVMEDQTNAGVPYWLLITRRNQRMPLVFMPVAFMQALGEAGVPCNLRLAEPSFRYRSGRDCEPRDAVFGTTLDEFLTYVNRETIEIALAVARDSDVVARTTK